MSTHRIAGRLGFAGITGAVAIVVFGLLGCSSNGLGGSSGAGAAWPSPLPQLAGFGTTTPGGAGGTSVVVSSLADSGPGTLRDALSAPANVSITFSVAGTIALQSLLDERGKSFVTIDAMSAPSPGITLTGHALSFRGSHDIKIQGIRVRDSVDNGIVVWEHSYNVVIDHCSVANSGQVPPPGAPPPGDKNLDITEDTHDVTVSWSIIGDSRSDSFARKTKAILIANFKYGPVTNVSLHNNVLANDSQRNPQVSTAGLVDIRDNVIENWAAYGIRLRGGATGNVVGNVFKSAQHPELAVILSSDSEGAGSGPVYIAGNNDLNGINVNGQSTAGANLEAPAIPAAIGGNVGAADFAGAGVFPRDAVDQQILSTVTLD